MVFIIRVSFFLPLVLLFCLIGGYTTGPANLISLLRQKARPYLFSNSLPPAVVASASKVFDILVRDTSLAEQVTKNTELFRRRMTGAGFKILVRGGNLLCDSADCLEGISIYL